MTASPQRRRRSTIVGAVLAAIGTVAVIAVIVVAVSTLRSSQEGRAPEVDRREVVTFPSTPNAVIGVVDDLDRLTSLAVLTLAPEGVGGSIVTVPVNADQTNGFGPDRLPVSRRPYVPGDTADAGELVSELEPVLTLTIQDAMVAGPDELDELLEPFGAFELDLDENVVDSDTPGSGIVIRSGPATLDTTSMVEALTAIDGSDDSYDHHAADVELWRSIAAASASASGSGGDGSSAAVDVPLDDDGRPIPPESFDELWARLFAGDVGVRDLDVSEASTRSADNETDADFVLVDRSDALLVFGGISPGLVSTPNESLTVALVVGYDPEEVEEIGDAVDGTPTTKTSMTRSFIRELIFAQANIVGVDLATTPDDVPAVTELRISSESMEDDARALSDAFTDAEVVVADRLIDGVDVVVVLGADFLEYWSDQVERERGEAEEAEREGQVADFAVDDAETDSTDPEGTEPDDASDVSVPGTDSDTVVDDE